jgi:integrase
MAYLTAMVTLPWPLLPATDTVTEGMKTACRNCRLTLSTYIQAVCALRFFYQNTLHRRIEIDRIPLPRYEKKLPVILSKAEVKALLEAPRNLRDRAILAGFGGLANVARDSSLA